MQSTRPPEDGGTTAPAGRRVLVLTLAVQAAVQAVVVVWSLVIGRSLWFFSDMWPLLYRSPEPGLRLLDPHGGHWTLPSSLAVEATHALAGMTSFVPYYLPVLLAYAVLVLTVTALVQWATERPVLAVAAGLAVSVLPTRGWITAVAYLGGVIVTTSAVVIAALLVAHRRRGTPLWPLALVLTLVLCSSGQGVSLFAATACTVLLHRDLRHGWPWLVPPAIVYGGWYLRHGRFDPGRYRPTIGFEDLLAAPLHMADLLVQAAASALPDVPGQTVLAVFLLLGIIVVGIRTARAATDLRPALTLLTLALLGYVGLVAATRLVIFEGALLPRPYRHMALFYLVVLAALAAGRLVRRGAPTVALSVVFGLLAVHGAQTYAGDIADRARVTEQTRREGVVMADLVERGAPAIGYATLSPQMNVSGIRRLVDDEWPPALDAELAATEASVLGQMVMVPQAPETTARVLRDWQCEQETTTTITIPPGVRTIVVVRTEGTLVHEGGPWRGERPVDLPTGEDERGFEVAAPTTGATLHVRADGSGQDPVPTTSVCRQ